MLMIFCQASSPDSTPLLSMAKSLVARPAGPGLRAEASGPCQAPQLRPAPPPEIAGRQGLRGHYEHFLQQAWHGRDANQMEIKGLRVGVSSAWARSPWNSASKGCSCDRFQASHEGSRRRRLFTMADMRLTNGLSLKIPLETSRQTSPAVSASS